MRGWRPALRMARRSVRRNLARSVLIAALMAVPVAGATLVDVLVRTITSPTRDAERLLGPADAHVAVTPWSRLDHYHPTPYTGGAAGRGRPDRDPARVDILSLLPPGSRAAPEPMPRELRVTAGERSVPTTLVVADPSEPLQRQHVRLESGRRPARPDEALVSPSLAARLGLSTGMTFVPADGTPVTVSGLARAPFCLSCERVFALPGSQLAVAAAAADARAGGARERAFLVDLPPGVAATALAGPLAARGVALTPRDALLHPSRYEPPGGAPTLRSLRTAAMAAVIGGLGLLEVVLLAGTAFAVGARRQTRELGLAAAVGATAGQVRRIVLAEGVVLGALGAVAGVALGAGLAVAGRPLWESFEDARLVRWTFGPWEIAGAAAIGLASGVAAAVVPAIGAGRMHPVDALAGRFRATRSSRRRAPLLGAVALAAGIALGLAGDRMLRAGFAAYAQALAAVRTTGLAPQAPSASAAVALVVGGAVLLVAGIVGVMPALIGALARAGARAPVSARLAFRDAARHRHRTGPATSAVAIAVAGSVVLAFLVAGTFRAEELRHVPLLPPGVLSVVPDGAALPQARIAAADAAAVLPGARRYEVRLPLRSLSTGETLPVGSSPADFRGIYPQFPTACPQGCALSGGPMAVAGSRSFDDLVAGGTLPSAGYAALAAGRIVVFDHRLLDRHGRVAVDGSGVGGRTVRRPATAVTRPVVHLGLPSALVPASVVRSVGWETAVSAVLVRYPPRTPRAMVDHAIAAAQRLGARAEVETGPPHRSHGLLLGIAAAAGLVTLLGVAISVSLSAAEGRPDLATLAAVGAAPRRRRALAASQALLVAGLGCALGLGLGGFVGFVARATTGAPGFVVPWDNLLLTGLAVPVGAVLVAMLLTPSRLPLVRRAG